MEKKELRLGNLINLHENIVVEVSEIKDRSIITSHDLEISYEYLSSIPLTEEWLLKFGFDKITNEEGDFYQKGYVRVSIDEYEDGWFNFRKRVPSQLWKDNLVTQIKFVHELQSLYLLIEKEELNIR
ncbi:hypothetical protein [Chryseobacterium sp.]|uniref:hypothetical protein n=1 Tax=Chryseobacterium sp. TaxID=1871047 RepID=UPI00321B9327